MSYKFQNVKILVVEDMQPMMSLTRSILNIFGFREVYAARDGEEGFELARKYDPDIIISDWMMEPVDGLEMVSRIRRDPMSPNPYVPVILATGFSAQLRVMKARDIGVTEFLVKPYSSKDLYQRLVQVIERPRQFVDTGHFFGPDRRRKKSEDYAGPKRREGDSSGGDRKPWTAEQRNAAEILRKLREQAEDTAKS